MNIETSGKVDLSGLGVLKDACQTLSKSFTKVGVVGSGVGEVAEYGFYNEVGSIDGKLPSRPFLSTAFREGASEVNKLSEDLLPLVLSGDMSESQLLSLLGDKMVDTVQQTIDDWKTPPNAESTKKAKKGADNPLVDEGRLKQSISHQEVIK